MDSQHTQQKQLHAGMNSELRHTASSEILSLTPMPYSAVLNCLQSRNLITSDVRALEFATRSTKRASYFFSLAPTFALAVHLTFAVLTQV
jgi:hypothetical protein